MPELPDVEAYVEALRGRVAGRRLARVRLASPFVLRTVDPPVSEAGGRVVAGVRRLGKRVVLSLENDVHLVLHLMVAGRLRWRPPGARPAGRAGLAALDFEEGTVLFTEASTRHRASLHLARGEEGLRPFDAGGVEPLEADLAAFEAALRRENRTLKRALTDPALVSGVGNAFSDEILHRARLSPVLLTSRMTPDQAAALHGAPRAVLGEWTARLRAEARKRFPEKVTAFRPEFAVHGKFGQPCPACGTLVQRIVKGEHETNYCPRCQTGGRMLADRALSRLLHDDWPSTVEEWEERMARRG